MECYQEVRVLPDPEFTEPMLMAVLFSKLHRALGAHGKGNIGISFPEVGKTPGAIIRLHGCQSSLEALEAAGWRAGLNDYCAVSAICPLPAIQGWRTVSRVQVKSSAERLMRRSVRKGWLTQEQADRRVLELKTQRITLPFLQVKSLSSGQHFRLFIRHGEIQPVPVSGTFNSYGLSDTATVPWF